MGPVRSRGPVRRGPCGAVSPMTRDRRYRLTVPGRARRDDAAGRHVVLIQGLVQVPHPGDQHPGASQVTTRYTRGQSSGAATSAPAKPPHQRSAHRAAAIPRASYQQQLPAVSASAASPGPRTGRKPLLRRAGPRNRPEPWLLHVCSDVAVPPGSGRCRAVLDHEGRRTVRQIIALCGTRGYFRTLSSGLLIRGFGVRVPGGAPVLTWSYVTPGLSF
jgi:hypothetical protein